MRFLLLDSDYEEATAKKFAAPSHVDQIVDRDTTLIAPNERIIALLLCGVIPSRLHKLAYGLWKAVDESLSNRATAVGSVSLPRRTKKDGTPSPRRGVNERVLDVLKARYDVLGYLDRPCRKTPLSIRHPEMLYRNRELIERVDQLYADQMPSLHAIQRKEVDEAPRYRLWNTAFSTIYLAKNLRTAYHADRGNLRGVVTAIMPMGKYTGGELVLPRWRIAIAFKPGDLLLFDPQQLHGNLPFRGERLSAAFYCERRIANCGK